MGNLAFLVAYFTNPVPMGILIFAGVLTIIFASYSLSRTSISVKLRHSLLSGTFYVGIFVWFFVALSLILSGLIYGLYDFTGFAIKMLLGTSLLSSLAAAFPISVLLHRRASQTFLLRPGIQEISSGYLFEAFKHRCVDMHLGNVRLLKVEDEEPLAIANENRAVIVSRGTMEMLDAEELDVVLAHELAHIEHGDCRLKSLISACRLAMLFDPIFQVVGAAVARDREFFADEIAAKITQKPLALASALVKIHDSAQGHSASFHPSLSIRRGFYHVFSGNPPLTKRVNRLLLLQQSLALSTSESQTLR